MSENIIRIVDPDQPIYRIFPLWFFEEALRLQNTVLAHPSTWEDPYELLGGSIPVRHLNNDPDSHAIIDAPFLRVFAQCWSATKESDTLLRAYSRVVKDQHVRRNILPREEGVRVSSTPRKLLNALETGTKERLAGQSYIGSVRYISEDGLAMEVLDIFIKLKEHVFDQLDNLVNFALLKRNAFSHEAEVRLLFISDNPDPATKHIRVKIDPNAIFDEVTFDPRLEGFERKEREDVVRKLRYSGKIVASNLYQRPDLSIFLNDG